MRKPLSRAGSIAYLQLSNVFFAATAVFISILSDRFDGYFTSFCRFLVGLAIGFTELRLRKRPFKIVKIRPWIGRGIFGAAGMTLYYLAIAYGNPGRASLFNNSYPIFVAVIAIAFLRDRVRLSTIAGLALAFSGVAFVLWDGSAASIAADVVGLVSGVVAAVAYHFNKAASLTEDPIVIYLGVCCVGLIATAFSVPQALQLDSRSLILLVVAGLGGYFAQICITIGLRDIPTTEGSIHTFGKIPFTVIAGAIFLGDAITGRFVAGTALLIAGLIINQMGAKKKPAAPDGETGLTQ